MNALLICNVGTRDVMCADFPKANTTERQWAQEALARYDQLRAGFELPIIGKALHYLDQRQIALTQVILIASDQPAGMAERFRQSDTVHSAALITRLLTDGLAPYPPIAPERIVTWIIRDEHGRGGDPSDYDLTLRFCERMLAPLAQKYPGHTAFLQVSGGTPAMTTSLLIAGTEAFGGRTEVLSIPPQAAPVAINTGRRLLAAPLRATIRSNADTYAYAAAVKTFLEQEAIITDRLDPVAAKLIAPLLAYAHHRFNFDFASACRALDKAGPAGPWQAEINELRAQVTDPDRVLRLAEVVHAAAARYEIGLYADFLVQVVRFEENLLRYLCLQRGAIFRNRQRAIDADGPYLAREWLQRQSFSLARDRDPSRDLHADRSVLRELLEKLMAERQERNRGLLAAIDQLGELIKRRNELTHQLEGVQKSGLARAFAGPSARSEEADRIVAHLQSLYEQACGKALPASPYQRINGLLERLLRQPV